MTQSDVDALFHLSGAKRAILARRLKGRTDFRDPDENPAPTELIEAPEARHAPYPVRGFVRDRLRYRHRKNDCRLIIETRTTDLDPDRLAAAWRALRANVDAMRARIADGDMVVSPTDDGCEIVTSDVRNLAVSEREQFVESTRARFHAVGGSDARRAVEIAVVRIAGGETACFYSFDLLVLDLVSIESLALWCRRIYETNDVPERKLHLQDYRRTEDAYLASSHGQAARRYWDRRIASMGPRLSARALRGKESPGRGYGYLNRSIPRDIWLAGRRSARSRGVSELTAVQELFTDLLAHLSGQSEFAYETRLFQRLPFHHDVNELQGQFSLGHLTGRCVEAPRYFVKRVRAEQEQMIGNAQFGHFDAATHWSENEPEPFRGGKIVFTNACIHFEDFVLAGNEPPIRWLGECRTILQTNPDTALEFVLVENAGDLEIHWFLNHEDIAPGDAEAAHGLLWKALFRLCTDDTAWDAENLFAACDARTLAK